MMDYFYCIINRSLYELLGDIVGDQRFCPNRFYLNAEAFCDFSQTPSHVRLLATLYPKECAVSETNVLFRTM